MMKLLLENWRKFLTEEEIKVHQEIFDVLKKKGIVTNRILGQGYYGTVFEIEDPKTGERRAAKVVYDAPNEGKIYSYVMKNRDKFGEYSKYLPEVFSVEDVEHQGETYTIIQMELLESAPEEVRRLFAAAGAPEEADYSVRDKTMFKNQKFVTRLTMEAVEDLQRMLDSIYDYRKTELYAQQAIKRISGKFFSAKIRDNFSAANKSIVNKTNAEYLKSKESITLLNLILDDFADTFLHAKNRFKLLQPHNWDFYKKNPSTLYDFLRAAFKGAANVYWEAYSQEMIPTSLRHTGSIDPEETADLPEVQALTTALKKLKEMGLDPADVHAGNIMVRSGTKDVVFVDLGLFSIGE